MEKVVGTYIDLFAGCGGLSLGLGNAGWKGIFAVEKDEMAYSTFKHNLIDGDYAHFDWPSWLPKKETTIQEILEQHEEQLALLRGKVDLIAGGPPCQGFSMAGRRDPNDARNLLANEYIRMVQLINPKFLIFENVRGFNATFSKAMCEKGKIPQSVVVKESLEKVGYKIFADCVNSQDFGVPQQRKRFLMIGVRSDLYSEGMEPFSLLKRLSSRFLEQKNLPKTPVSVKAAIGDLEVNRHNLIHHSGSVDKGFRQIDYKQPSYMNKYLKLMREGARGSSPNSLRLPRHKAETVEKFKAIKQVCRPGISLSESERKNIGTKKLAITVLHSGEPSKTLTTLPDDLLHYSEPRILTVRENARLQSFPDRFNFCGKYTTGGDRRTKECPRYTQVGNAVPPLLGEVLGLLIVHLSELIKGGKTSRNESDLSNFLVATSCNDVAVEKVVVSV